MAENNSTVNNQKPTNSNNDDKQKKVRGVFPRLPLAATLELAKAIYELGEGERVRRLMVFHRLNRKPDSGTSRHLVTTANSGYDLIKGGYNAEWLELTPRGIAIVGKSDKKTRLSAIFDALFGNPIFGAFVTRFANKSVPADDISIDYLQTTHSLSREDAQAALAVFRRNIEDYGLVQELSGRKTIIGRDMALASSGKDPSEQEQNNEEDNRQDAPPILIPSSAPNQKSSQISGLSQPPQFHINLQIHLPENAMPEIYEAIFKSIATHLLRHDGTS